METRLENPPEDKTVWGHVNKIKSSLFHKYKQNLTWLFLVNDSDNHKRNLLPS